MYRNTYRIDKAKNTILLAVMLMFVICMILAAIFVPIATIQAAMILSSVYCAFLAIQICLDYRCLVCLDENGVEVFRRGKQYKFQWTEIKRIEYRGSLGVPIFDILVLHFSKEQLYLEYTFFNYIELWSDIVRCINQYSTVTIIDRNVLEKLGDHIKTVSYNDSKNK